MSSMDQGGKGSTPTVTVEPNDRMYGSGSGSGSGGCDLYARTTFISCACAYLFRAAYSQLRAMRLKVQPLIPSTCTYLWQHHGAMRLKVQPLIPSTCTCLWQHHGQLCSFSRLKLSTFYRARPAMSFCRFYCSILFQLWPSRIRSRPRRWGRRSLQRQEEEEGQLRRRREPDGRRRFIGWKESEAVVVQ